MSTWTIKLSCRPWWPRWVWESIEMKAFNYKFFYYKVIHEYEDGTKSVSRWADFYSARDFAYNTAFEDEQIWFSGKLFRKHALT